MRFLSLSGGSGLTAAGDPLGSIRAASVRGVAGAGNFPKPTEPSLAAEPDGFGPEHRLANLGPELEPAAASLLALAFRDNPINRAVIERDRARRLEVNSYGMAATLAASRRYSFRRVVLESPDPSKDSFRGEIASILLSLDPGGYPSAPPPIAMQLRCLWGQGFRIIRRWGQLYRLLDRHHPKQPHCYLALLATHPERQHSGLGRALLNVWLRDVDARAMPSYLETDRSELIGFYQTAGFEVGRELKAFGRPIWCMTRPARNKEGSEESS